MDILALVEIAGAVASFFGFFALLYLWQGPPETRLYLAIASLLTFSAAVYAHRRRRLRLNLVTLSDTITVPKELHKREHEVFYPMPFKHTPLLKLKVVGESPTRLFLKGQRPTVVSLTQQRPDGFRFKIEAIDEMWLHALLRDDPTFRWIAKGSPAD